MEMLDRSFDDEDDYQNGPTIDSLQELLANDLQERLRGITGRASEDTGVANEAAGEKLLRRLAIRYGLDTPEPLWLVKKG